MHSQHALFERIHSDYESHYSDCQSLAYRERFLYPKLFEGLDLNHKWVADLACAGGVTSLAIKKVFPQARTWGFEISPTACRTYEQSVGEQCTQSDLTRAISSDDLPLFDAAVFIGGLHHCVSDLSTTLENVAKMLKPGGILLMAEPSSAFFLEPVRKLWYFLDRKYLDHASERALSMKELSSLLKPRFSLESVCYRGGPAYFLILNSLLLRIPKRIKGALFHSAMAGEEIYNQLSSPFWFPLFLSRWVRT